ncbi:hypothetical protein [Hymenobacter sedentarius]|uniref:hypothetical protein n=1 Tax=Hymenobacter sedentarius TaxID=1411621 RepID=UPI000A61ABA7|nr:hypothetical protein [Hymenobacter sedentarius]
MNMATFHNLNGFGPRYSHKAGVMAAWERRHFAVQPAVLFSPKGYISHADAVLSGSGK